MANTPATITWASNSWSTTDSKIVRYKHSWNIQNPRFLFLKNADFGLKSNLFEAGPLITSFAYTSDHSPQRQQRTPQWMIQILKTSKDYFGFYLLYVPTKEQKPLLRAGVRSSSQTLAILNIPAQFALELIDSAGSSIMRSVSEVELFSRLNMTHGFDKFVTADVFIKKIVPDSHITVVCELFMINNQERLSGSGDIVRFDAPSRTLARDLEAMYSRKELTDITFVVGNQELEAHKPLLMARSPVFAAMFSTDMQENRRNRVDIADIEAEVFEELLRFVYTDQVRDLRKHAKELLMAAEKYALDRLKALCEQELFRKLSVENAAETMMLADLHNAEKLKKLVLGFVAQNRDKVASTATWKTMRLKVKAIPSPLIVANDGQDGKKRKTN